VWEILSGIEILLIKLEKVKKIYKSNKYFSESINMGWKKLQEYYAKLDVSLVYAALIILNSSVKLRYFDIKWSGSAELSAWILTIKESV